MNKIGRILRCACVLLIANTSILNYGVSAWKKSCVAKAFIANQIVPDVVSKAPSCLVSVRYPSGEVVNLGNELTPKQTKDMPTVSYKADPAKFYTLAMIDPDVPSRADPKLREISHWLVGNIPGDVISSGETLTAYLGPVPPKNTRLHRYVVLVYKQPKKITFTEPRLDADPSTNHQREKFSIAKFAKKYNLRDPIAGNFFQAQNKD